MEETQQKPVPETIAAAAAWLRQQEHVPAAHADLFEKVGQAQWQARRSLQPSRLYPPLAPDTAAQMLRHGFYLIDVARLQLDPAGLGPLWEELVAILASFGELGEGQARRLRQVVAQGKLSLPELAAAAFRGESDLLARLAKRVRVSARVLGWLATLMLRPYLSAAAEGLVAHLKDVSWAHPYCPVCGHHPLMAVIRRPEGRRELECSLCFVRWEVRRGRCVFCGNEDKDTYKFFFYDLESPYRVDVCDRCHRYLKSVDERKMAERPMALLAEDIATLYLDQLARRKRYQPPWAAVPGGGRMNSKSTEEEVVPA